MMRFGAKSYLDHSMLHLKESYSGPWTPIRLLMRQNLQS